MPTVFRLRSSSQSASGQVICRSCRLIGPPALLIDDVHRAELGLRRLGHLLHGCIVADVGGEGEHAHALLAPDLRGHLPERLLSACQQHEVDAFLGEAARNRLARCPCWHR